MVLTLPLSIVGACSEPAEPLELARAVIGPRGGIITSADSVLTIAIPPGALDENTELFIERSDEPPEVFGQAYLVRPNPALHYDVTVTYRQELPDDTSGLAVGAVDLLEFEAKRGRWAPLPVLRVDAEAKLISGLDDGLSIFYALLDESEVTSTTSSSDTTTGTPPATTTVADDTATTSGLDSTGFDDDTTGPDDDTTTGSDPSTGEPAVSYARDVEPILLASCGCHTDDVQAGLSLTDGYANLVDVASTQVAALDRIEPGALDDSYLWHKLSGTHLAAGGSGDPMPAPAGDLDAGSLATIEAWILDGAQP